MTSRSTALHINLKGFRWCPLEPQPPPKCAQLQLHLPPCNHKKQVSIQMSRLPRRLVRRVRESRKENTQSETVTDKSVHQPVSLSFIQTLTQSLNATVAQRQQGGHNRFRVIKVLLHLPSANASLFLSTLNRFFFYTNQSEPLTLEFFLNLL